ncbi:MAG: (Fe-S)-binding protein [Moraxellaceae bacterium]|nr:(Fe-S)-binding protein [Moraxellaceae bacterium]
MTEAPRVGLFATCLMNVFRPNLGHATLHLLELAGCVVEVPTAQTCCGQPAYNSGDFDGTRVLAKQVIRQFERYDYVVGPSGSCMATIRKDYPRLFDDEPDWRRRAEALAAKAHELISFLLDVRGLKLDDVAFDGTATYHDSCSGLRELGVKQQPRELLAMVRGLQLKEMRDPEVCCGFGGTFCVKYPEISTRIVDDKLADIASTGADTVLGGDLGCLMNIAGRAAREGKALRVFHAAEVLAGMADGPGLGGEDAGKGKAG